MIYLLCLLLFAILSVVLAMNIVNSVSAEERYLVTSRAGEVIYLDRRDVIVSSSGAARGGGEWTWDDVLSNYNLLCCGENDPIPGRTLMESGKKLDWNLHCIEGGGGDIDISHLAGTTSNLMH